MHRADFGKMALTFGGTWSEANATHDKLTTVQYNGSLWLALEGVAVGDVPGTSGKWALAARGQTPEELTASAQALVVAEAAEEAAGAAVALAGEAKATADAALPKTMQGGTGILPKSAGGTGNNLGGATYLMNRGTYGTVQCSGDPEIPNTYLTFVMTSADLSIALYGITMFPGLFVPNFDNQLSCGGAAYRWTQIFAASGGISTSDEREKSVMRMTPEETDLIMSAWSRVGFVSYQMLDAVSKKGPEARIHWGVVAQRVKEAFESKGLDAFRYGLLCYDEWDAEPARTETTTDEKGTEQTRVVMPARAAGNRYGIRYEEALCLEAAYQRWRADKIEARLAALEASR